VQSHGQDRAQNKKIVSIGRTPEEVPDHHIGMYLTPLGNKRVAVADPLLGLELYQKGPAGGPADVETDISKYKPFLQVVQRLEEEGFLVVRVPMLLTRTPRVFVSYNNVILERRADKQRVYMPVYGIPSLDRAAGQVFESQGWRVIPIRVAKLYRHTSPMSA